MATQSPVVRRKLSGCTLSLALVLAALGFSAPATAQVQPPSQCSALIGSSQSGDLFQVDLTQSSASLIGLMPVGLATEIEYDPLGGILYAEETDGGINLHTIDMNTAASTGFVSHVFGALNGLELVGATLYGTFIPFSGLPSDLVTINPSTGAVTTIGPTGFGPISGLAYHTGTGILYGITAGGGPANLVRINLATGAATLIGPTGLDRIGSIEFGPDGILYGGVTAFGTVNPNWLVRIDTATGAAQPVFNTGFSITGLTALVDPRSCLPPGAVAIPTLSAWSLWCGAALLLLLAVLAIRRREAA